MNTFSVLDSGEVSVQQRQEEMDRLMMPPPPRRPLQQRQVAVSLPHHENPASNKWVGFHKAGSVPRQQQRYEGQYHEQRMKDSQENFTSPTDLMELQHQRKPKGQVDENLGIHTIRSVRPSQKRRESCYFHRDNMLGQSKTTRDIAPTSLFHTKGGGFQGEEQDYHDSHDHATQESNESLHCFADHQELDVSPVKTVIVSNKKQKRHNSTSSGTSTLVMKSTNSGANDSNVPTKSFNDIIGHRSVKIRLEEIILPIKLPPELSNSVFRGIRALPMSVLLMGPPGTGKTLLAKAVAGEAKAAFLPIGPSDILSKYVGESEAAVRTIFAKAVGMAKQVESRVAVIFFDEIDALGHSRGPNDSHDSSSGGGLGCRISSGGDLCSRRVLAELLIQLSRINCSDTNLEEEEDKRDESPQEDSSQAEFNSPGFDSGNAAESLDSHVFDSACHEEGDSGSIDMSHVDENSIGDQKQVRLFVLAATNRPEDCDPALLRRFGIQLKVGLPHSKDRIALLKHYLKEVEHTITDQDFSKLALATKGCSGSELESLTRESVMAPVRECIREAAAVGRRFMKQHLQAGGDSSDNVGQLRAQIYLEEEIVHLRPVMLYDYVDAIKFWRNQLLVHSTNHTALPLARLGYGDERRLESLGSGSEEDE